MPIIEFLQSLRSPVLDIIFKSFTFLGNQEFYILLLPVIYWSWRKETMQKLAFLLLISFALNAFFKNAFALPRPPLAYHLVSAEGYGLPSGHAQGAITLWGFVFLSSGKNWVKALTVVFIIGIALSRLYLGVHFPKDVIAGLLIGGVWLAIFYRWNENVLRHWKIPIWGSVLLFLSISVLYVYFTPTRFGGTVGGAAFGLFSGILIENRYIKFQPETTLINQIAKFIIGIIGIIILYLGLKTLFPQTIIFRVIRYACIGIWMGFIAPWVFMKLRLTPRQKASSVR